MPIVANKDFKNLLNQKMKEVSAQTMNKVIEQFAYVGERCSIIARDENRPNTWKTQTGNLRSSVGYSLIVNGSSAFAGGFQQSGGPKGNGEKGESQGKQLLEELKSEHPTGICLTVVAGMDYASYVQDIHHKDVLISAQLEGERLAEELLSKLFSK